MTEKRTDLALEARESFPRNHVEIQGVVLEKKKCLQGKVKITTVIIRDEAGSKAMKKPKGTYITIESPLMLHGDIDEREPFLLCVCEQLESMIKGLRFGCWIGKPGSDLGFIRTENDRRPFCDETF